MITTSIKLIPRAAPDDKKHIIEYAFLTATSAAIYNNSEGNVEISPEECEELILVLAKDNYALLSKRESNG